MAKKTFRAELLAGSALAVLSCVPAAQPKLARTIPMPGVEGRIDHLAYDPATQRLFVAARGNGSLEVVDLGRGERVKSFGGLREPQGVVLVPATREVLVACGGGDLCAFDADLLVAKRKVHLGEDADNIRLMPDATSVLVGHGSGALACIDAKTLEKRYAVALNAHPESFQFDTKTGRVLVNTPGSTEKVCCVELARKSVTSVLRPQRMAANYPMCLAVAQRRVFLGCRSPAQVIAIDLDTLREVARFDCVSDADDMFLDAASAALLVIGGGGTVDVFTTTDQNSFTRVASVPTAPGARTGLLVPERQALYVAAPVQKDRPAAILELLLGSAAASGTTRPSMPTEK